LADTTILVRALMAVKKKAARRRLFIGSDLMRLKDAHRCQG
jgi:hypothetical protein